VQVINWESVRRRRTAAGLLAAALALAVGGCSDSAAAPDQAAGSSAAATAVAGADAQAIASRMTKALVAAGGGTMTAALEQGSITGALSFGPIDASQRISEIWNTGTYVSSDRRTSTYLMHTGPGPDDVEVYVNDGTPVDGRPWAKIPQFASQMKDAAAVARTHPYYRIVADAVPGLQPHVLPSLLAAQKGLVRSPAAETVDGVEVSHYLGSFDGTVPTPGAPTTFELWIDNEGRPTRYLSYLDEVQVSVGYGDWGKQKPVAAPPPADTSVIPSNGS
jgi:hypothetical protein